MTATGSTVKIGSVEVPELTEEMSFTVPPEDKIKPEQAAKAGQKYKLPFSFGQVTSEADAEEVCKVKDWNLVDFVNDALKSAARSSKYQSELALYKPSEVSPEDIKDRMVRDYIRLGVDADVARKQVEALLASK